MPYQPLVSIVINNFNYARFLKEAIDSALAQTYSYIEVIVVDDGSTDNSQKIINSYGNKIIAIFQENGGQASALNAGFMLCKGEVICFMDADDIFFPQKITQIVQIFAQIDRKSGILLFHELEAIDLNSKLLHFKKKLDCSLSDLNYRRAVTKPANQRVYKVCNSEEVYQHAIKYRYIPFLANPTSSLCLNSSLGKKIFPLPQEGIKICADVFLVKAASLLGEIYASDLCLGCYRMHDSNNYYEKKSKPLPKEYLFILDNYLNSKLQTIGKKSILSFFDSLHAQYYNRYYFSGNAGMIKNLSLAFKVLSWHTNKRTIIFTIKIINEVLFGFISIRFSKIFSIRFKKK